MPTLKDMDIHLCESCGRIIQDEYTLVKGGWREWMYHTSPTECSKAKELKRDWIRNAKKAKAYNRTKA